MIRLVLLFAVGFVLSRAEDWPRFRGPNGSGVSTSRNLPIQFSKDTLIWKTALPTGHSSPILMGSRIYLTGVEDEKLFTFCLNREDGRIIWKREAPRSRKDKFDKRNNAASPSVAVEDKNLYVFFQEFGMLSYTIDGKERWRLPLGPFDNMYGMGASPIIVNDQVVLMCDQTLGSFIIGVDKNRGTVRWKQMRSEAVSGHSTPVLHQVKGGPLEIIAPGSFRMDAYQAGTGEPLWFVHGLASEMKSVPVVDGDIIYINGFNMPENDPGRQVAVPAFEEVLPNDKNKDGALQKEELPAGRAKSYFEYLDLNHDGKLDETEWKFFIQGMAAENGLLAIRAGGKGDVTASNTVWKFHRSIPQLPSTLLYQGVLYMVNDGGILTTLDPSTGKAHHQGRLRNASDRMFASPVAADGMIYYVTQAGVVIVMKAGTIPELIATSDLGEDSVATPAIVDGRIYIRTSQGLYAYGKK